MTPDILRTLPAAQKSDAAAQRYWQRVRLLTGVLLIIWALASFGFVFYARELSGVKLLGTRKQFTQRGQSGAWVSDMLPYTAGIVDDISIVTTCKTDLFNHAPAKLYMNTGSGLFGRPSMGSWVTYGLGAETQNLPSFVVMSTGSGISGGWAAKELTEKGLQVLLLERGNSTAMGFQLIAIDGLLKIGQRRLCATCIGVTTAVEIGLRKRLRFQRRLVMPRIDENDLQAAGQRPGCQAFWRRKTQSQQGGMQQQRCRDRYQEQPVLSHAHAVQPGAADETE